MTQRDLIYVATPYSRYDGGLDAAFVEACKATAEFIRRGVSAYSPIAHTHPVAIHGRIDPLDHERWMALDAAMMDAATELYVVQIPGWDQSKGISIEITTFVAACKPVRYFSWPRLQEVTP